MGDAESGRAVVKDVRLDQKLSDSIFRPHIKPAAEAEDVPAPAHLRGLRLAVPVTVFQNDLSPAVADTFKAALARLSAAGATVVELPMAEFAQAAAVNPRGALTSAEAYSWHKQ